MNLPGNWVNDPDQASMLRRNIRDAFANPMFPVIHDVKQGDHTIHIGVQTPLGPVGVSEDAYKRNLYGLRTAAIQGFKERTISEGRVRFCRKCGSGVPAGAPFCDRCGANLD